MCIMQFGLNFTFAHELLHTSRLYRHTKQCILGSYMLIVIQPIECRMCVPNLFIMWSDTYVATHVHYVAICELC